MIIKVVQTIKYKELVTKVAEPEVATEATEGYGTGSLSTVWKETETKKYLFGLLVYHSISSDYIT